MTIAMSHMYSLRQYGRSQLGHMYTVSINIENHVTNLLPQASDVHLEQHLLQSGL